MLLLTTMLLGGCTTTSEEQAIGQVKAPFEQSAITLAVQTTPDLNALHGIANSCTLLIIQAQRSNTLNKLLSNPAALKSLFSAAGAQDDILKVDRYAAMPGQETTLHIDRSENSRFIAIIAGYYPFPQKQHMALVAIPVATQRSRWWSPTWQAQLAPLAVKLRLGSHSITRFDGAALEPITLTSNDVVATFTREKRD